MKASFFFTLMRKFNNHDFFFSVIFGVFFLSNYLRKGMLGCLPSKLYFYLDNSEHAGDY